MKNFYTLCIILSSLITYSQIPNGNFESWETTENYEVPSLWETNQDSTIVRVSKDEDSFEGNYAMKFSANGQSAWFNCASSASLNHKFDQAIGPNQSFFFHLKAIPLVDTETPFFQFYCRTYIDGIEQEAIEWIANQKYTDFTLIEIPIINPEIDSIQLQLASGAMNGPADGCHFQTEAWIDQLFINASTTSTEDIKNKELNISPNPSAGSFYIDQNENEYQDFCIFNHLGIEIQRGTLTNDEITLKDQGIYFIHFTSNVDLNRNITKKVIVAR